MKNSANVILNRIKAQLHPLNENQDELPNGLISLMTAFRELIGNNDLEEIRRYALECDIYKPEWVGYDASFNYFPDILSIYLFSIGWDYHNSEYIDGIDFDPYEELSAKALTDCCHIDNIMRHDESTVQRLVYDYMRGDFPFVNNGQDLCINNDIELPYSTLNLDVYNHGYVLRIPRSFSLFFRGDEYTYYTIDVFSELIREYENDDESNVKLVKDRYGRFWFCVEYSDVFDDRIERTFELVNDEADGDLHYSRLKDTYHYLGKEPYFFSTENEDFILHSNEELLIDKDEFLFNLKKSNGEIAPQLYFKKVIEQD